MDKKEFKCKHPREVAEEALWLAWQACGSPLGMGIFQDRAGVTKEDVVGNVAVAGDYPGMAMLRGRDKGKIYADYVFGRMMKFNCEVGKKCITYSAYDPTPDYQAWCVVYPTYDDLFGAAVSSLAVGQET